VQVVALRTEQVCGIGGNGVELRLLDGGDDDRTADGIHAGIGNTWGDELALNGERNIRLTGPVGFKSIINISI